MASRDPELERYRREIGWYLLPNNQEQRGVGHGDRQDSKSSHGGGSTPSRSANDTKGKS